MFLEISVLPEWKTLLPFQGVFVDSSTQGAASLALG